jgi:hypothetical protein
VPPQVAEQEELLQETLSQPEAQQQLDWQYPTPRARRKFSTPGSLGPAAGLGWPNAGPDPESLLALKFLPSFGALLAALLKPNRNTQTSTGASSLTAKLPLLSIQTSLVEEKREKIPHF